MYNEMANELIWFVGTLFARPNYLHFRPLQIDVRFSMPEIPKEIYCGYLATVTPRPVIEHLSHTLPITFSLVLCGKLFGLLRLYLWFCCSTQLVPCANPSCFEGWIWVPIASVPGRCILLTFIAI